MVLVSSLSHPPPSYSKANLRIPIWRACLQAKVKWVKVMPRSGTKTVIFLLNGTQDSELGRTPRLAILEAATTSSTWYPGISFIEMARHHKCSLYGRGIAWFSWIYLETKSHITLRSCLLALCFDLTTLIEIAVYSSLGRVKFIFTTLSSVYLFPMKAFRIF